MRRSDVFAEIFAVADSATIHYERFAVRDRIGGWARLLALPALLVGVFAGLEDSGWQRSTFYVGLGLYIGSQVPQALARRSFSQAVEYHNGSILVR